MQIQIFSDVVCPWCYIGKRRFERALEQFPHRDAVELRWRSFELNPAAPKSYADQGSYPERLSRKYGTSVAQAQAMIDRITRTAADEGLRFDFEHARTGNSFDAHRLLHLAAAHGKQDALKERLLRATFSEGEAIGDPATLVRLAADAGLDEAAAHAVVSTDAYAAEVRADQAEAHAVGVSGVPFFVIDGTYGIAGAQPSEVILSTLERAWADAQAAQPGG